MLIQVAIRYIALSFGRWFAPNFIAAPNYLAFANWPVMNEGSKP